MPSTIINEFIVALDQEIAAIKRGKGGSKSSGSVLDVYCV